MKPESSSSRLPQSGYWVAPISPENRITALDALRGFALLGILFVNIMSFSGVATLDQEWTGFADRTVQGFIQFFVVSKFLSLFAMLFGIGFAIQIARLEEKTSNYLSIYVRRLLILFLFGAVHLVLDPAEVLHMYALCGMLTFLFRGVSLKALLLWALLLMPLPHLHTAIVSTLASAETSSQVVVVQTELQSNQSLANENEDTDAGYIWNPYATERAVRVHSEGTLSEVLVYNVQFTANRFAGSWVSYLWMLVPLPLMLIGVFIGRSRILERISDEIPLLRKTFWLGLAFGIVGNWFSLNVLVGWASMGGWNPWIGSAANVLYMMASWSMALAYGAGIILLLQRVIWKKILTPLQAVGRLALTNFLLQTLICTTLFYSYGLGLYGKVDPVDAALLALAIYSFQIALSLLWTRYFLFGPAEWLWRSLTYGQLQPMRSV